MTLPGPRDVLVTGGGGFVGSHLVESLLAQGCRVRTVDLNFARLAHLRNQRNLQMVVADIAQDGALAGLLAGVEVVYHLASAHLDVSLPEERYWQVNVEATRTLLRAAHDAGVMRFVHCSSNSVVGPIAVPPVDETTACHPTNIYAETKLAGEEVALAFWRETGLPVVVARPSWVYGPRCPRTSKLFRTVGRGRFIMFGDGQTLRHPIYVADAVRALELCAEGASAAASVAAGEIYFLAGNEIVTIAELIQKIAAIQGVRPPVLRLPLAAGKAAGYLVETVARPLGKQPPVSRRSLDFFLMDNAYCVEKAKGQLGFEAAVDLDTGLKRTYAYMQCSPGNKRDNNLDSI